MWPIFGHAVTRGGRGVGAGVLVGFGRGVGVGRVTGTGVGFATGFSVGRGGTEAVGMGLGVGPGLGSWSDPGSFDGDEGPTLEGPSAINDDAGDVPVGRGWLLLARRPVRPTTATNPVAAIRTPHHGTDLRGGRLRPPLRGGSAATGSLTRARSSPGPIVCRGPALAV